jgi:hypothetical protein
VATIALPMATRATTIKANALTSIGRLYTPAHFHVPHGSRERPQRTFQTNRAACASKVACGNIGNLENKRVVRRVCAKFLGARQQQSLILISTFKELNG